VKLSISEARSRLPELVRKLRRDPDQQVFITVNHEVAAELRAAEPQAAPGAAVKKLQEVMSTLPKRTGRKTSVSSRVDEVLYERPKRRR
jgi:hypothetical protein